MPNTLHLSSLTLWLLGGLHILPRNWPTDTHTPFSLPLTNNKITTCYIWLGLGAISARFQVFHRNYNKIKIPETVWISTSRQDNGSRTNTMESKTWNTEFGNTLCLLVSWVPGKHKKQPWWLGSHHNKQRQLGTKGANCCVATDPQEPDRDEGSCALGQALGETLGWN